MRRGPPQAATLMTVYKGHRIARPQDPFFQRATGVSDGMLFNVTLENMLFNNTAEQMVYN